MVEDNIIIHDKKINYILFIAGFALCFATASLDISNGFIQRIVLNTLEGNIDFLTFHDVNMYRLSGWLNFLTIFGIILCFIFGRKILINKRFTVLSFVLLLLSKTILLLTYIPNLLAYNLVNIFFIMAAIISIVATIFILLILIKNKILSKLLLISIIFIGIQLLMQFISAIMQKYILSFAQVSFIKYPIANMLTILSYINSISSILKYVGFILISIYLVKCFVKNNVFNTLKNNILLSIVIMLGPSIIITSVVILVYIIGILIFVV